MKIVEGYKSLYQSVLLYCRESLLESYKTNPQLSEGYIDGKDLNSLLPIRFTECESDELNSVEASEYVDSHLQGANHVILLEISYGTTTILEGWFATPSYISYFQPNCITSLHYDGDREAIRNPLNYQKKIIETMVYECRKEITKENLDKANADALNNPILRSGAKIKNIRIGNHKVATLTISEVIATLGNPEVKFNFTKRGTKSRFEGSCSPATIVHAVEQRDKLKQYKSAA